MIFHHLWGEHLVNFEAQIHLHVIVPPLEVITHLCDKIKLNDIKTIQRIQICAFFALYLNRMLIIFARRLASAPLINDNFNSFIHK